MTHSFELAQPNGSLWWRAFDWSTIYAFVTAGVGFSFFWWQRTIVAENGIIKRNVFVPWSDCRRWYWDACNKNVAVVVTGRRGSLAMKVPAAEREALATLLTRKNPSQHDPKQ